MKPSSTPTSFISTPRALSRRSFLRGSGERGEVDAFLKEIADSGLKAHIKGVTAIPIAPLAARGFEIVA